MVPNPYLLAADNSPDLLPLLRENPAIASEQDEHGYSLLHAAASYNHLDLLRALVQEFKADVNIRDEDEETPLFVVETVEAARLLVEELGADIKAVGSEGVTARQKIEAEGDFPLVAEYLSTKEDGAAPAVQPENADALPPLPPGLKLTVGTMDAEQDVPAEVDSEFRRKIEELAERDDFHTAEGQAELRRLVEDAVLGEAISDERNVRQRQ
ncbi:hypothetical protein jhhlp_008444 [Lomentospora prolificans]|uniref:Uncharacterized protein n=1 Tax=Lomentospora prolificans TaxID=41688 RepID=A0A2N3MY27_9PEZI|nr:hypothetical protein jhhlp_008444 [Lomentospora prolificans]